VPKAGAERIGSGASFVAIAHEPNATAGPDDGNSAHAQPAAASALAVEGAMPNPCGTRHP
jgi:hypothetical protein